jgi:Fe-S-cluster containining protein
VELERKLEALRQVLAIYDEFAGALETACRTGCSRCCTDRVTLTTLEACALLESLPAALTERLLRSAGARTHRMVLTTNALAELCAEGREPPEADEEAAGGCPLLAGDLCPIYALRPFNCRCFVSRVACAEQGTAEVDEATVAVNTLFLQTIEHIDAGGCTGYLPDVVAALADPEHAQAYREGVLGCADCGLAPNRPLRLLMVPPELRTRIDPLVARLREIRV